MNRFIVLFLFLWSVSTCAEQYDFSWFTLNGSERYDINPTSSGVVFETKNGRIIKLFIVGVPEGENGKTAVKDYDGEMYSAGRFILTEGKTTFDIREGWYVNRALAYSEESIVLVEYKSRENIEEDLKENLTQLFSSIVLSRP
ncbi:hypothetical protein [Saccharophagus degradans]|uniref:Uncharacterized protein n=1 Tax=Saccharophagus degradans TaxID=86304 RepID=A0AAW7X4I1_9GAMM|nr:hypothetical protein [Saccharophagus degradans]MDO6422304.1 hypothetical protein [Saccharophagus degradans]MDO6608156.1 hypothetical protein [Saccharophagus degradans]